MPLPPAVSDPPVTATPHVFYLHGFTSSSKSTKATYFGERLRPYGIALHCPDFNEPDFESLTMTRMLAQLSAACSALPPAPIVLIGSSLGGALAILASDRIARVDRLVLLAPAVMFARPGQHLLSSGQIEQWRRQGAMPFFHYGYGEERLLGFTFYEDLVRYDPLEAKPLPPTLVFQGLRDKLVDFRDVERFADRRPNVTLSLVDDDHQLLGSLALIWDGVERFLELKA
jgi:pimeloyl-ACP methyl ester carboxylesterase